ncbi:sphingosine-1-phosphate phosphatase 2-like isoform X2 [Acanthaster planci]|uniref:Sphingosine-1-phosphate phosphatase 2-like isoform X2 n=1 Tax=Acanthaster planci TaxID=133434 RepID=A0A8B7YUC6_ACAPL|nr:sphingosine-1-phosphate phosphatase 2-like isoform X2 [Acanthaster planci]
MYAHGRPVRPMNNLLLATRTYTTHRQVEEKPPKRANMKMTWPKIFGSSSESNSLPLYDACTVARLQRFFGLYPAPSPVVSKNGRSSLTNGTSNGPSASASQDKPAENGTVGPAGSEHGSSLKNGSRVKPKYYVAHNKWWFYLFSMGATLGDDVFYFMIFPMAAANLSWWATRRMVIIWGICMYIGQASKELLKWPRPSEPPVVRLERRYFMEYGMPSTHAMVGTLMPFTYLAATWNHYEDLVVGVTLTAILMLFIWPWLDVIDHFILTHPQAPLVIISSAVFLCICYPSQNGVAATRADTITILGSVSGILCGFWFLHRSGMVPDVAEPLGGAIAWPGWGAAGIMLLKYAFSQVLAVVVYLFTRAVLLQAIAVIFNTEINENTKKLLFVELPYRYITFLVLLFNLYVVSPLVFAKLGV